MTGINATNEPGRNKNQHMQCERVQLVPSEWRAPTCEHAEDDGECHEWRECLRKRQQKAACTHHSHTGNVQVHPIDL